MKKQIIYLYPEIEGKQQWICWGIECKGQNDSLEEKVVEKINEGLNRIKKMDHPQFSQRSFTILLEEVSGHLWVAMPRQLPVKLIKAIDEQLESLGEDLVRTTTANHNPFKQHPIANGAIYYDCGFIVDSRAVNQQVQYGEEIHNWVSNQ